MLELAFLFGLALSVVSCAHFQSPLSADTRLDHRSAVVYGRFSIGHHWAFKNKLALWLVNVDNQKPVYLFFDENEPVYAVHVKPGTYQVSGFVGLNRARQIEARKEIPGFQKPFVVAADAVIYLGDFSGETEWDGMMVSTWRRKSRTDNFVGTTREFISTA